MKYPAFIQEMAAESNRRKLYVGVWSGYAVATAFLALAVVARSQDLVPPTPALYVMIAVKYATNTLNWIALRKNVLVLEAAGLNTAADLLVLTGAIYYTGAQVSPLHSIYVIEIAVVGMLSNRGITIMTAVGAISFYGMMSLLVHAGALPFHPPPVTYTGGVTGAYVAVDFVTRAALLGGLTYYLTVVLRLLRDKESALERKTDALIEASQHKQQFTTNITHELRTPIHGILGLTETLRSGVYGELGERQAEALTGIDKSASSLLHMVDDLLELARADAGKLAVHRSTFALDALLEEAVSAARWMQGRKELAIDLQVEHGVPPLEADRDKLGRVVANLLSNAIKFTPAGGQVKVRARRVGADAVEIAVADTGIGIPNAELPLVFEEFRQADGTSSRRYGGAGVGLAVVKRLTEALGGSVTATSDVRSGSTFAVRVPIR